MEDYHETDELRFITHALECMGHPENSFPEKEPGGHWENGRINLAWGIPSAQHSIQINIAWGRVKWNRQMQQAVTTITGSNKQEFDFFHRLMVARGWLANPKAANRDRLQFKETVLLTAILAWEP